LVSSQVRQAEQQRLAAQQGLRYADEQSRLDVLSLAKTVQMAQSRLQALRQAVVSNEAFLQAAEEGNRVGLKSLVDVLNARTLLYKAKQDLANTLFDDVQNRLSLRAAQGVLARDDLASIERYLRD
jgi:outer membrane protein